MSVLMPHPMPLLGCLSLLLLACAQDPMQPAAAPQPLTSAPQPVGPQPVEPQPVGPQPVGPQPAGPQPRATAESDDVTPPKPTFVAEGCEHEGVFRRDGEPFTHAGKLRCFCWMGQTSCVPVAASDCPYLGRWLKQGEHAPAADGCNTVSCYPRGLMYSLVGCEVYVFVEFVRGSAKIGREREASLQAIEKYMNGPTDHALGKRIASVIGCADPNEPNAQALIKARARAVRDALLARKIPSDRLILPAGAQEKPSPGSRTYPTCDSPRAIVNMSSG